MEQREILAMSAIAAALNLLGSIIAFRSAPCQAAHPSHRAGVMALRRPDLDLNVVCERRENAYDDAKRLLSLAKTPHRRFGSGSSVAKQPKEKVMERRISIFVLASFALLSGVAVAVAQQAGTAAEARTMLDRAVAALKTNEAAALAAFNDKNNNDFHYADLYVFCFDMTTGKINAHANPALMGRDSRTIKLGGEPLGQRVFDVIKNAPEGTVSTVAYIFPKPRMPEPVPKESYVTRIGAEGCGVGYYK